LVRRSSVWSLVAVVSIGLLVGALPAAARSSDEQPAATEIGVTANEIRIGVVADVDTPLAPGLFQGAVEGATAAAKYLNSKAGGGGVAGRKLVVDFIDSKLNANASRNAVIEACSNDLAMVGTAALFLSNMADALACTDQAGEATGLPDFPAIPNTTEACTPISFPPIAPLVECSTIGQTPQTYQVNRGTFAYLQRKNGKDLHGAMVYSTDTKEGTVSSRALIGAATAAGIEADEEVGVSAVAPQSAYTPIIQQMKQHDSNFAYPVTTSGGTIQMMSEAKLQGLSDPKLVWTCSTACYDKAVKESADTDGLYVQMNFMPFEDASSNKSLANFMRYVGRDKASGYAVYGWVATLEFAQAVKAAVAKDGVNGLTRASLLDGAKTLTAFDAGGMIGTTDVTAKKVTRCTILIQLVGGQWKRVWPTKKGTFDCSKANATTFEADLEGG
jgi:hypothetical protein